jgi:hypothetical protein
MFNSAINARAVVYSKFKVNFKMLIVALGKEPNRNSGLY